MCSEFHKEFKAILRLTAMLSPLISTVLEIILDKMAVCDKHERSSRYGQVLEGSVGGRLVTDLRCDGLM